MTKPKRSNTMVRRLTVRRAARLSSEATPRGHVKWGSVTLVCALGRGGIARSKREGDGATPAGRWALTFGYFRPDRMARPFCRVPLKGLHQELGWCDDPGSALYNRPHKLPMRQGHEVMWRVDGLYDVVLVMDYNLEPRRAGRGSAIFLHCAKEGLRPTLGCVALRPDDMRRLLPRLALRTIIVVL